MSEPLNCPDRKWLPSVPERRPELYPGSRAFPDPVSGSPPSPHPVVTDAPPSAAASLHRALSLQNLSQTEKPWENVTLNRCLFVAITILVLTSGFQKLHGNQAPPPRVSVHPGTTRLMFGGGGGVGLTEALRGQRPLEEEEDAGLKVRRSGALRHRQEVEVRTPLGARHRHGLLCFNLVSRTARDVSVGGHVLVAAGP